MPLRIQLAAMALALGGCATGGPATSDSGVRLAPSIDAGPSGRGECGTLGNRCCDGFCDEGLTCDPGADVCEGSTCGGAGQDCCSEGPPCQGSLTCLVSGICEGSAEITDAGSGSGCGMRGAACCATDPPCGVGLDCGAGGTCEDAPACGAIGQPCCAGDTCTGGLCEAGTCRNAAPACASDGASCGVSSDCCSGTCSGGVCGTPSSGGGDCSRHSTCGACTNDAYCMWCGGCEPYVPLGEYVCAAYPEQC